MVASLLQAAFAGDVQEVQALIAAGADVNARDDCEHTPLMRAAFAGHAAVVSVLVAAGSGLQAPDNCGGPSPLHWAILGERPRSRPACVSALLAAGAPLDALDGCGRQPLHTAAGLGNAECMQLLLEAGASLHCTDVYGHTPLHIAAAAHGSSQVCRLAGLCPALLPLPRLTVWLPAKKIAHVEHAAQPACQG